MAIVNGKFVPDNFGGSSQGQQNATQQMQSAPAAPSFGPPQPTNAARQNQQTMNYGPQMGNVTPSNQMAAPLFANQNAMKIANPQYQQNQTMQFQRPQTQQLGAQRSAGPMGVPGRYNAPQQGYQDPGFQGPQQAQGYQQPNVQAQSAQYQQVPFGQQGQSITQSVQSGNPQSVQNFLTALNQAGAGTNNTFMNAAGQQGQQAQGGFQGFGYNGQQAGPAAQMYSGPMGSQLGYAGNMSGSMGGPSSVMNYAQQGAMANNGGYGGVNMGATGGYNQGGQMAFNTGPTDAQKIASAQAYAQDAIRMAQQWKAASDVNSKQEIEPGQNELEDFLSSLGVYSYEYKNKEYGEGRRISPMAQEIESTPLGKAAISVNKEGYKQVDYGKLGGTMLAATAMLNNKVNKLAKQMQDTIAKNVSSKKKKG